LSRLYGLTIQSVKIPDKLPSFNC